MSNPNQMLPQGPPQGPPSPYNQVGHMPPYPDDPNLQQPVPNQQPPQQDPAHEARVAFAEDTQDAYEPIRGAVLRKHARLGPDLDEYKTARQNQAETEATQASEYYTSIKDNPQVSQDDKDAAYKTWTDLHNQVQSYEDPAKNREHMKAMLRERVDAAREKYAKHLAARRDGTVAIANGRKGQVDDAKIEYDVAVALFYSHETDHLKAPEGADAATREQAKLDRRKVIIELDLGKPGDDPETSMAEKFRLGRAERDARKVRSGRFVVEKNGELRKDNAGQAIEKDPRGPIAKAYRDAQNRWNKWTEDARDEKWYSGKALWARTKKAATLGAAGVVLGALAGTSVAGAAVGAGVALGAARSTKAIAGFRLNQGAELSQADAHFKKIAAKLEEMRDQQIDILTNPTASNGDQYQFSVTGASVLASEIFSKDAHKAHRRNLIGGTVGVALSLGAGAWAGEALHHLVYGSDDVNAQGLDRGSSHPTGGGESQTPEPRIIEPSVPHPEETQGPQLPGPNEGDVPQGGETVEPQPHPDHEPEAKPGTDEPETTPDADQDQSGEAGGHDPEAQKEQTAEQQRKAIEDSAKEVLDEQKQEQQPQGPQVPDQAEPQQPTPEQPAPGEVKQIGPDQMKDKWVAEVYSDQLGEGGFKEMEENATAAMQAGEIEQVQNPNGTYHYRLTEAGAAKLPGAGTGSSTTYDVMRILASHSDKIDVA